MRPNADPLHGGGRRIMAVVLPDLLDELAWQRVAPVISSPVAPPAGTPASRPAVAGSTASPTPAPRAAASRAAAASPTAVPAIPAKPAGTRGLASPGGAGPRAVVLVEFEGQMLEPGARIDAVNAAARRRGVHPRRTIAQATAIVESLAVYALPLACVTQSLKQVAEAALGFGSPVAFEAPDTVWVDVTGTCHLFGGERELALALVAHVRALGHTVRVAAAPGPWLAQAFARHSDFDEAGVFLVAAESAAEQAASLPIAALPISSEAVTWFSRLGLLSLEDLRKLPPAALAARLESPGVERTLDLIQGRDNGVLAAHLPEDLPLEEQSWDCPLENVEPLSFVLKGLAARLASRLEGRGQAARELLLTIQYDRALIALRGRERAQRASGVTSGGGVGSAVAASPAGADAGEPGSCSKELRFRLATPLSHADDLERIVRSRLQRETLAAPARGLRLQVTGITEAQHRQLGLDSDTGLAGTLSTDPRTMAVLVAELSADIGGGAVGLLETRDSHLPEKSSAFIPMEHVLDRTAGSQSHGAGSQRSGSQRSGSQRSGSQRSGSQRSGSQRSDGQARLLGRHGTAPLGKQTGAGVSAEAEASLVPLHGAAEPSGRRRRARGELPTRLITPIEVEVPLREKEIIVLGQCPYVIESIVFEQRLEAIEWWAAAPVSRDYFRLWLTSLAPRGLSSAGWSSSPAGTPSAGLFSSMGRRAPAQPAASVQRGARDGLAVLLFLNRDDGRKYVQAVYD